MALYKRDLFHQSKRLKLGLKQGPLRRILGLPMLSPAMLVKGRCRCLHRLIRVDILSGRISACNKLQVRLLSASADKHDGVTPHQHVSRRSLSKLTDKHLGHIQPSLSEIPLISSEEHVIEAGSTLTSPAHTKVRSCIIAASFSTCFLKSFL